MKISFSLAAIFMISAAGALYAADDYPNKPVSIIVPLSAGGTADGVARVVAEELTGLWGTRVVVENRPGGNTIIGTDAVAKAAPDGYTLGLGIITSHAANEFLFDELPYDPADDFASISLLATSPLFLITHPSVPADDLAEFIEYVTDNPGELSFASTGYGSSFHLATEQMIQQTGIDMVHIPYSGMGEGMVDLLAGNVQVVMDITTLAQVREGQLKALAVTGNERFVGAPEVPTFGEQNIEGVTFGTWLTLHAPAGIDPDIQNKISQAVNEVLQRPIVQERLLSLNYVAQGGTPDDLDAFLASEREEIGRIIETGGITLER